MSEVEAARLPRSISRSSRSFSNFVICFWSVPNFAAAAARCCELFVTSDTMARCSSSSRVMRPSFVALFSARARNSRSISALRSPMSPALPISLPSSLNPLAALSARFSIPVSACVVALPKPFTPSVMRSLSSVNTPAIISPRNLN